MTAPSDFEGGTAEIRRYDLAAEMLVPSRDLPSLPRPIRCQEESIAVLQEILRLVLRTCLEVEAEHRARSAKERAAARWRGVA